MLTLPSPRKSVQTVHNTAHLEDSAIPSSALLSSVLKTIEVQFQKKGLLPVSAPHSFNPLWFTAETERNVFLWRQGKSLIDSDNYEFWIDVPKLIAKRIRQLQCSDSDNPFVNPLWGEANHTQALAELERDYLATFLELMDQVGSHAHALSRVGSELQREVCGGTLRVVLPSIHTTKEKSGVIADKE